MPELKLTYFDFHGGRGEAARLAMALGGVNFEDHRVTFAEWPDVKPRTPYGAMPVLEVDGKEVAQSNGINRFVGKLAGLYPDDPFQAVLCDEVMDAVEDVVHKIEPTFSLEDEEEKKARRKELADGPITTYLKALQGRLEERGGEFFADNRLTVADLKVFVWVRHLRSGRLEHVPTDLADRVAPRLVEHCERLQSHPGVKAYYEARGGY